MSLEKVKEAVEKVKNYNDSYKKILGETFDMAIKEVLINYPDVKKLIYVGYTPGFNDGDPCTHNQDLFLNQTDEDEYEEDDDGNPIELPEISYDTIREINSLLSPLDDIVEMRYGTDFKITYTLENGEIKILQEDYYCGY